MNYYTLLFTCLLKMSRQVRPLTCSDVALLGHWDQGLCCKDCHAESALILDDDGHRHRALLCCHASLMLHGFEGIPDHAMECA